MENQKDFVSIEESINKNRVSSEVDQIISVLSKAREDSPDVKTLDNVINEKPYSELELEHNQMIEQMIIEDAKKNLVSGSEEGMTIEEANRIKALKTEIDASKHDEEEQFIMDSIMKNINTPLPGDIIDGNTPIQEVPTQDVTFQKPVEEVADVSNTITVTQNQENVGAEALINPEELENIPASTLEIEDEDFKKKTSEIYDISDIEAAHLLDVMTRYRSGEKFNVFEALPTIMKAEIMKQAAEAGVSDKATINFFAKSLINDLIDDTYMTKEIKNFESQMAEINNQLGNVTGMAVDEYSDETKEKFEDNLLRIAEKIKDENPEKSESLKRIANRFHATYNLDLVFEQIDLVVNENGETTSSMPKINCAYKNTRKWNQVVETFDKKFEDNVPKVKSINMTLIPLMKIYHNTDKIKTFLTIVSESVLGNDDGSIESHIYAYYIMNSLFSINMGANTSFVNSILKEKIDIVMKEIDKFFEEHDSDPKYKKNKKKNRK